PAGHGVGPLVGAADVVDLPVAGDHTAVDDPGDHRGHPVGGDDDHRLVEERTTLLDEACGETDDPGLVEGEGGEVGVGGPAGRACGRGSQAGRRVEVAAARGGEGPRQEEVARDAVVTSL